MRALARYAPPALAVAACSVALGPAGAPSRKAPTYASNVAPILNRQCVECHRPGQVAPFSLIGYENARKWSGAIVQMASARQMPPWKAVHGFGEFADERRLTDEQIQTLSDWDAAGAPRGDAAREPKPPTMRSGWTLGEPDLLLQPDRAYHLAAEGDDVYRNFILSTDFKEPVWVTGLDVRPGNPKVVHHVIVFLDGMGAAQRLEEAQNDGEPGYTSFGGVGFLPTGALGGWAPGLRARLAPEGTGLLVKPGVKLVLQVHYHKSGKPEVDRTQIGLYLARKPPEKQIGLMWLMKPGLKIPAGEQAFETEIDRRIGRDVTVYGAMPHMHLLGRMMQAEAGLPDGKRVPLIKVEDWDFRWQMAYGFRKPLRLPAGTHIRVSARYDNSASNPRNPNHPPKDVAWGEQTTDEMFLMIVPYTLDGPGEPPSFRMP